jgi:hypothetical protein
VHADKRLTGPGARHLALYELELAAGLAYLHRSDPGHRHSSLAFVSSPKPYDLLAIERVFG